MFNAPEIHFVGNLVDDPELRFTPSGAAVANMRFAITPRIKKNDQYEDGETVWLSGSVWRQQAENVADTLTKGMRVIVVGQLTCRSYETRDGEKRVSWEVEIEHIGPDLRNATARVNKVNRSEGGGQQGSQTGQNAASQPPANPFAGGQQGAPAQNAPQGQQGPPSAPPTQQPPSAPPSQPPAPQYAVGDVHNGWQLQADGSWTPAPTNPVTGQQAQAQAGQQGQQSDPWQTPPAQDPPPF